MPTPFSHLKIATRLQQDADLPPRVRKLIMDDTAPFLLGNVAADARVNNNTGRGSTHFYEYNIPITEHPWRVMMQRYPALTTPTTNAHLAFLAGYVAHLAMDEYWSLNMLKTHFVDKDWHQPSSFRFLALHLLLIAMDERDYPHLLPAQKYPIQLANPQNWLPFLPDKDLREWRNFIAQQLPPEGVSQTLDIFGGRIQKSPEDLRQVLDSETRMQESLWRYIPQSLLSEVEEAMYHFTKEQMSLYVTEVGFG